MPFKSGKQRRYLAAKKPKVHKQIAKHKGSAKKKGGKKGY